MNLIIEIYSFYFLGIIYAFIFSFLTNNKIAIQIVFTEKGKQNFSVSIYGFESQEERTEEHGNHCAWHSFRLAQAGEMGVTVPHRAVGQ